MKDELEPVAEETALVMAADELCAEDACYVRIPGLDDIEDDHEVNEWVKFLLDLDDADSGTVDDEDALSGGGFGFIEDTHGGAVFVPYC